MKTVFALFNQYRAARSAVDALLNQGFEAGEMNAILLEATAENSMNVDEEKIKIAKSEAYGKSAPPGLERMLGGEKGVRVPDTGVVIAAGELATQMTNTASQPGAADGGLKAALEDFHLPEDAAEAYLKGVNSGGVLFFIRVGDERAAHAADTLRAHDAAHISSIT